MLVGRWLAGTPAIGCPAIAIVPSVGWSKPASMRRSVVLPQPDGPRSEKNSPAAMVSETSSRAVNEPKRRVTRRTSMIGADRSAWARSRQRLPGDAGAALGPPAQILGRAEQDQREQQDQRAQGQHVGQLGGEAQLAPDVERQRGRLAAEEEGQDELVERDGEADQEARDQPRRRPAAGSRARTSSSGSRRDRARPPPGCGRGPGSSCAGP